MNAKPERAMGPERWERWYVAGELPRDSGKPDRHLKRMMHAYEIQPTKALEIGCGTGTNSVWSAPQGFNVTGMDLS